MYVFVALSETQMLMLTRQKNVNKDSPISITKALPLYISENHIRIKEVQHSNEIATNNIY